MNGSLCLYGDYTQLRVGDEVKFCIEGRVTMISVDSLQVEVDDAELEDATTVHEAGRRAMRSLLRDNPSSSRPPVEPYAG